MIWTEKLLLFTLLLQTIEYLLIRPSFSDLGIWRTNDLRYRSRNRTARFTLSAPHFTSLLVLRVAMILVAMLAPTTQLFLFLFGTQLFILIRFRGAFNGGSDYLTTLALALVWISHSFPQNPWVSQICLLYLGLQVCLSYFISGLAKLKVPAWRSGRALSEFLQSSKYLIPKSWQNRARDNSALLRVGSWSVLAFELSFPIALLDPRLCWLWMTAGIFFHLMNYRIFGLNRFFWIWIACYPALLETSQWIALNL